MNLFSLDLWRNRNFTHLFGWRERGLKNCKRGASIHLFKIAGHCDFCSGLKEIIFTRFLKKSIN